MLSKQVYEALNPLLQGKPSDMDEEDLRFLQERGLITVMNPSDYAAKRRDADRLHAVRDNVNEYRHQIAEHKRNKNNLEGCRRKKDR